MASRKPFTHTLSLLTGFAVFAGATVAYSDLADEPAITEGLISVAIAYEISRQCDDISARRLAGINYLFGLKNTARDLGYSDAEIDAFTDDDVAQDRLETIARQRLRDLGAAEGSSATYCAVGEREMQAQTPTGRLLR